MTSSTGNRGRRVVTIPSSEVTVRFVRSQGPGGQNTNKVATKVELRWRIAATTVLSQRDKDWIIPRLSARMTKGGELVVTCDVHRTQHRNWQQAKRKMHSIVNVALERPVIRRKTKPSLGSIRRRIKAKKHLSAKKKFRSKPEDF